ncbi:histone deacetylase 2a-like protein, partial [Genlisea aurea]
GVEVKSGETHKVIPGDGYVLHLSQASLGELKKEKGNEAVYLSVNVKGQKLILGTLFTEKLPQQQFDLVFDNDFEISHNWKKGSVYFYGYKCSNPEAEKYPFRHESEPEEEIPANTVSNEKPAVNAAAASKAKDSDDAKKQKVKIQEPKEIVDSMKEDDSSDDDDDDVLMSDDDEADEDDDSSESDEETPAKAPPVQNKKRAAEPSSKTPSQTKKPKSTPSSKTDGKKAAVHIATPYPSKQAGKKTPGEKPNNNSNNPPAQKSGGAHHCNSCNRTFATDKALESHNSAKHAGAK